MEPFLGQIILSAMDFAPRGWHLCDGSIVPIQANQALFALLGTRYGGDGRTTFGLPKLDSPDGLSQYIIAVEGMMPVR